jgi:hypothetical protein
MRWFQGAKHRSGRGTRKQSNDLSPLNWIKAWSEFRLRLTLPILVPAGAGVRASWGLPTVGTLASGLHPNQVPIP